MDEEKRLKTLKFKEAENAVYYKLRTDEWCGLCDCVSSDILGFFLGGGGEDNYIQVCFKCIKRMEAVRQSYGLKALGKLKKVNEDDNS